MFGDSIATGARVSHRAALVDGNRATQIRFVLILPDIKSIGLAEQLPIDRSRFVTRYVRAMLLEFDTGADVVRSMQSTAYPLDNPLCQ